MSEKEKDPPTEKKKDPFAKMQEQWKKGWEKVQTDWNTGWEKFSNDTKKLFTPKAKSGSELPQIEDQRLKIPEEILQNSNEALIPADDEKKFPTDLKDFQQNVTGTIQTWQNQWNSQLKQWQETNKQKSADARAKMEENIKKILKFFDDTNAQMKANLQKLEDDWRARDKANRAKFYGTLRQMRENWNSFVLDQQKTFEKNMVQFNRKSIQREIRFLIWALPFIFIILLFVFLFRPFFM
jgi:hypothetical protein